MSNNTQYIIAKRFGRNVQSINNQIDTLNKRVSDYAKKVEKNPTLAEEKPKEKIKEEIKNEPYTPIDFSGDFRLNPIFLRVADYLGLESKDYPFTGSKIAKIIDWASRTTKSKDPSKIISKIGQVSKGLQSPGFGERRYAILYRYVRLAQEQSDVKSGLKSNPDNPVLLENKNQIQEEMQAYKNDRAGGN